MSTRVFRIFGVSENSNSFGLHGVRVMSPDGAFFKIGLNDLNLTRLQSHALKQFVVPCNPGQGIGWHTIGAEIPEYKGRAPFDVVKEIFFDSDLSQADYDADTDRYCEKSETKWHEPDAEQITVADGAPWIVDVACTCCGRSGSIALDPGEINW